MEGSMDPLCVVCAINKPDNASKKWCFLLKWMVTPKKIINKIK